MSRKRIIIIAALLLVIITAALVYDYTFNSAHRDIASEKADVILSAKKLSAEFQDDETNATANYLDKVIELKGKISAIEDQQLVINNKVQVSFGANALPEVKNNDPISIKGRCVGYDELLEMVKIDQATVIEKDN